jgi:hypothetical protein
MKLWIKNTKGVPDAMLTFATIGFFVTTFCLLASLFTSVSVGDLFTLELKSVDNVTLLGYLGATLTAYVTRRNKKDNIDAGINE